MKRLRNTKLGGKNAMYSNIRLQGERKKLAD